MQLDPLNDALVKIFNAEQAGKFTVELDPASKLLGNVLNIMQTSGYVGSVDRVENGRGDTYVVELRGTINLPARDFGLLILTTNSGVMHHYDAKDARIGGKLLAYVY